MKAELVNHLKSKFPILFPQDLLFEILGDGWFPVIENMAQKLIDIDPNVKAMTIKEKFGKFRLYIDWQYENDLSPLGKASQSLIEMWRVIEQAELEANEMCEDCGKPGRIRGHRYIRTLCEDHFTVCPSCSKEVTREYPPHACETEQDPIPLAKEA